MKVAIIQLSRGTYFWVIKERNERVIASSKLIAAKHSVAAQAERISRQLGLGGVYTIEERD